MYIFLHIFTPLSPSLCLPFDVSCWFLRCLWTHLLFFILEHSTVVSLAYSCATNKSCIATLEFTAMYGLCRYLLFLTGVTLSFRLTNAGTPTTELYKANKQTQQTNKRLCHLSVSLFYFWGEKNSPFYTHKRRSCPIASLLPALLSPPMASSKSRNAWYQRAKNDNGNNTEKETPTDCNCTPSTLPGSSSGWLHACL